VLRQPLLALAFFAVTGVQPLAQALGILQIEIKRQRRAEGLPLLALGGELLLVLRYLLLLALLLLLQAFATGAQFGALGVQRLGFDAHFRQAQCRLGRFYRLILLNGRMAGGTA
jgi:hypothetical protein